MKSVYPYIFGAIIFFVSIVLTDAIFWADSADYVDSVIRFQENRYYYFWEFGHLFWRPLGWFVWSQFSFPGEAVFWRREVITTFLWFSYIAGFCSTLLLIGILRKLELAFWVIAVTTFGFVFSHAFLNFSQTGTSYIAALVFYLLGLFFSFREGPEKNFLYPILSGMSLAIALCFWVPFIWTVPAAMIVPLIFYGFTRQKFLEATLKAITFLLTIFLSYWIVLTTLQVDTINDLRAWIAISSHGNETRGIMRVIFGLARSFVNMGNDGILFKRFLINDAYNPVSFTSLISGGLWKLVLFYGLAGGVLFLLWQKAKSKKPLILVFAAAVPMLGFATFFDGGAVERYLPLYPFAFIGLATALQVEDCKYLRYGILGILLAFAVININALSVWRVAEHQRKMASRVEVLQGEAQPKDKIFLVSWTDDLINFNRSFPFHPVSLWWELNVSSVVTQGSDQTKEWREEFATRTFLAWADARNVWLTARAFSEAPDSEWNWIEGDDKNVRWREFPEFFGNLEYGKTLGDENGFALILQSENNKRFLQTYRDKFTKEIEFY